MIQMKMGGAERLVYNLALKLDRRLFNPSVAWFYGDEILKEFYSLDIPLFHVYKTKRIDLRAMRALGKIIRDNNIHIVNAHHFMSLVYSFYGSKIVNQRKLIYTEHSEWEIERIPWKWRSIGRRLLSRSDGAVGVSTAVSKRIQEAFQTIPSQTFSFQNGVEGEAFTGRASRAEIRKSLDVAEQDIIIGTVANFRKIKNHLFLLKAFSELVKTEKRVKLLLIGQGFESDTENSEPAVRDFINEMGLRSNVLTLGYRSDIPELLNAMDIFCLTSFKEGLPISLIEAMAAGLPVVGTNVEGVREVIADDRNGFLVSISDAEGLKVALHKLAKDESLRKKFGEESKFLAKTAYSLKRCVNEHEGLFVSVMNQKPPL